MPSSRPFEIRFELESIMSNGRCMRWNAFHVHVESVLQANPAMRNAVKSVGKMAKRKSQSALKEVRLKFKELQVNEDGEESAHTDPHRLFTNGKPRSAPSSPNFVKTRTGGRITIAGDFGGGAGGGSELSGSELSHSLRRCETSVNQQHFNADSSSPGYSAFREQSATATATSSSSAESSNDEDELNMAPLNLNLMDDMKDILSRASSSYSNPPSVPDRSVNITWLTSFKLQWIVFVLALLLFSDSFRVLWRLPTGLFQIFQWFSQDSQGESERFFQLF